MILVYPLSQLVNVYPSLVGLDGATAVSLYLTVTLSINSSLKSINLTSKFKL